MHRVDGGVGNLSHSFGMGNIFFNESNFVFKNPSSFIKVLLNGTTGCFRIAGTNIN